MSPARRACALLLALIVAAGVAASAWVASAELHRNKSWDERYSLRNVRDILVTGDLEPGFAWYPSLSHLPQTAVLALSRELHRATGIESLEVLDGEGEPNATAYLLSRWVNVLYGGGCLLLTFALGRRLFSREVGLLAAVLLAASPWQIRAASVYKPDPLLLLLVLATVLWSLRAAERGTLGSFLLAGAGVGLAASSKQTGAFAAIPVLAATLVGFREPRRWLGLAAAAAVSVAVFLALNPYPHLLPEYLRMAERYAGWATHAAAAAEQPSTPLYAVQNLLDPGFHGPVVGAAALAGFAGLVIRLVRRRAERRPAGPLAVFLSFPIGFPIACSLVSDYPKANILHPLLAFSSVAAAWALHGGWQWIATRLPRRARAWALRLAAASLALAVLVPAGRYVHASAVSWTTLRYAGLLIARNAPHLAQRTVVYELDAGALEAGHVWSFERRIAVAHREAEALTEVPERELDLADYEVFLERRLHGPERAFYFRRLLTAAPGQVWFADPLPLRRRGRRQVVVGHPWHAAPALGIAWRPPRRRRATALRGALPSGLGASDLVSLDLSLTARQAAECAFSLGEVPVAVHPYRWDGDEIRHLTPRFVLRRPRAPLWMRCSRPGPLEPLPEAVLFRWYPTAASVPGGG